MSGKSFRQFVNEGGFDQTIYNNWIKDVNSANESYNRYAKNSTTTYDKNHDLRLRYFDRLINRGNNIKKMLSSGAIKIGNVADVDETLSHLNEMKKGINSVAEFYSQFENEDSFYDWSFNNKYSGKTLKEIDDYIKNYANGDTRNAKREYDWLVANRDYFMSPDELQSEIKLLEGKSKRLQDDKVSTALDSLGNFFSDVFSSGETAVGETSFVEKNKNTKQASVADTENAARLDKLKKLYASHGDVSAEQLESLYKKADEKHIFSVLSPDYSYADYANDKADKNIYGSAYIQRKDQENLEVIQKHQDEFDSDVSAIESIISSRLLASDLASSATGGNILRGLNEGSRRKEIRATDPEILAIKQKWTDKGYDFDALFKTHERNSNTQYTEAVKNQRSEYAKEQPVLANIESVGTNLIGGIAALPDAIGSGIEDILSDDVVTMDTNSPSWALKNVTDSIRDTTSELLNTGEYGKFKAFLYQTGMSIADFSTTAVATGFAQPATLLLMGSNAAVDSMKTVTERGGSASDALTMGVLAGVFEAVMEKVPIDTIFKSVNTATGKAWIRNVFNGMMTEGFEELGTDLANNLVDVLLNADQSEFSQNVFNYMQNGMSASEASAKVFAETAANMGLSFLGGAISGGGMTAVGGGIGLVRADSEYKNIGNNVMSHDGSVDTVMEFAKELVEHDKAVAKDVKKVEKKTSARNVGRLYADAQNALSEQNRTTYITEAKKGIQARVEELGLDKSTSKAAADIIYKAYNGEKLTERQQKILKDNKYVARAYRELSAYNTQEGRENYTNSWVQTVNENIEKATSPISEKIATLSAYSRVSPEAESLMQTDAIDGMNDVMTEDALTPSDADTVPAVINGAEDFTSFVAEARTEEMNYGVVKKYNAAKLNNAAEKQIAVLDAYGKKHGLSFIVVDSIGSEDSSLKANGAYIGKNKMMVSLDSEAGAILSVAGHEVYHYISKNNKTSADSIKSYVLDKLKNDSEYNYSERFEKLAKDCGTEDVDTIEEEMVANAMFDILADENVINGLAKENPSLLEKIITAIKDFVSELKNMAKNLPWKEVAVFQDDMQSLETIKAMAEAALWQINENGKNTYDSTENATKNTATDDGEVKMSLVGKTQEGIEVYETSEKNKKLSYIEKLAIFKQSFYEPASPNFIGTKIGFIINGKQYYAEIDRFAVNENINKINPKNLNQWDKAKINIGAEGDFVNLVENVHYDRTSINQNRHKNDAHKKTESFDYFYKTVFIDRIPFEVVVNVRNEQNLNKFLYEVKLKKIKDSQLEHQLEKYYSQRRSKVKNTRLSESFVDNITQNNNSVNTHSMQDGEKNTTKFSFAGGNALTAEKSLLAEAMELEKNGVDSEDIRQSTGWFRGYDNKWRFEIDDSKAVFSRHGDIKLQNNKNYPRLVELSERYDNLNSEEKYELETLEKELENDIWDEKFELQDYLYHAELYDAYPQLRHYGFILDSSLSGNRKGFFDKRTNTIHVNAHLNDAEIKSTLFHELQHTIQYIEGFSKGANIDYWEDALMYDSFAGLTNAQKSKFKQLQQQYHDIEDSQPEFAKEMKKLILMKPSVKRGAFDFETFTKLEEDPPEWKQFDAERKRLEDKYGVNAVFDFMDLDYNIKKLFESGRSASEMYYDTAGEVEARDVANRLTFDEKDRKNTRPDIDREDVVFASNSGKSYEIKVDINGNKYVEVDPTLFDVRSGESHAKTIARIIKERFNNLISVTGQDIQINKTTNREWLRSESATYLSEKKPQLYLDKLKTISHVDEILKASNNWIGEQVAHERKDDIIEFARGTVLYKVGDNGYIADVLVGIRKNGAAVLYDLKNIYEKEITDISLAMASKDYSQRSEDISVENSIPQSDDDVNIKLSLKETAEASENRENLIKANDNLRVANALLKKELKLTQGKMISYDAAKNIAKYLTSEYSSQYDTTRLSREIYNIFNHYDKTGDYEYLMDYLATIGRRVVEQSSAVDNTLYEDYEDARKWVRHMRFTLPEQVLNQMNENYDGKYVRKTFGRMRYVSKENHPDAPYLSAIYSELANEYPNFFNVEDNEYEQPMKLIEFWDKIQPTYYNPLTEMGYASEEDAAVGFAFDVFKAYSEADKLETFADKKRNEINNLRKEYNRNLDRVKKKMSAERDSRLEYQKEYYINAREKSYDGRKKAYVKKKIRNVIKDLDKYLNRGSKDKNVKEGLEETVQTALSTAELLFSEVPTNEDIVRAGVSSYTQREAYWLDEYEGLLKKRDDYRAQYAENNKNQMSGEFLETREKLNLLMDGVNKRMKYLDKCLEELFEREKRRLEQATVSEALSKLAATYSKIKDSEYSYIAQSYNQNVYDKIADIIDKKGNAKISLLSTKELDDIYVVYKMVLHTVRNANKVFTSEKKETAEELGKLAMSQIREVGGNKKRRVQAFDFLKKFGWSELKPIYAFRFIGSSVLGERYAAMRNGEDTYYRDVAHAKEFYSSLREKYKTDEWKLDKGYEFVSKDGDKFTLSLEQIMSIYAYSRRGEQAVTHLVRGGFVFSDAITVEEKKKGKILKYKVDDGAAYSLSAELLAQINDVLDDNKRAYVEEMQKYLSDVMGDKGNEVSMKMYGVKLFNEKNYFPLKSSAFYRAFDGKVEGEASLKNAGFSKATTPKANNPIVLDDFLNVWSSHVQDMAMYHSFVLPIEDFTKVFNYEAHGAEDSRSVSVKATLQGAYGPSAEQYVRNLLTDLNSGVRSQNGTEFVNKLTGLAKKGAVFASMSVVIQQPSAVVRATAHVNPKYFINAFPQSANWLTVNNQYEELKKYAPVAGIKEMGYFDTGLGKSTAEWITEKEYRGFGKKFKAFAKDGKYRDEVFSMLAGKADEVSWVYIWNAVKKEVAEKQHLSGEALLNAAGKRFTEVVELTQVYDSVFSRSGLMRSKDTGVKMATAFMAEPTTQINMLVDAFVSGKRGNKKYTAAVIGSVYASILVNAMLKSIVTAARDDDDEFGYSEKYISNLIASFVSDGSIVSAIPFVKDVISLVKGYDVERMDMTVIGDVVNAFKALESDKKTTFEKILGVATSLLALRGVPATNILKDMKALHNTYWNIANGYDWSSGAFAESLKREITGKSTPKADLLYNAIVSGDTEYAERLAAKFETESGYNTAVREGLKKYDTRIHDAAVARMNGNTAEYMRLAKDIIAEKNFSQDNIVAAINSVINSLSADDSQTTSDNVKSIFTDADYFDAVLGGDGKTAEIVSKELVDTDVANGKTQEDAEKSLVSSLRNNVRDAFEAGEIDSSASEKILVAYCGMTDSEAENKVRFWDFKIDYPEYDLSEETVTKYYAEIKSSGISVENYYEYYVKQKSCKGVLGSDGKTVSGSKKNQIMKVIDDLPLTNKQKDVLYFQNGWSESNLYEAPWH